MVELSPTFRAPSPFGQSSVIKRKPSSNLWHAFNLAEDLGLPLTTFVTVNFAHTRCPAGAESRQFCTLLNRYFGPWWRRPGRRAGIRAPGPYAFTWVMEAAGGCVAVHLAIYIPDRRLGDFSTRLLKWVEIVAGGITHPQAVDVRTAYNPKGARLYMLKGTEPAYASFCKIAHVPQGIITGKRSGYSRSLGPTARVKQNYVPRSRRLGRYRPQPVGRSSKRDSP